MSLSLPRSGRDDYLARLAAAGIEAAPCPYNDCSVVLPHACDVEALPGFGDGAVSVQDGAAQLAAGLLDVQPGERVLDACAAPGGKTAHILERQPLVREVVAVDHDAARMTRVRDNLTRLDLEARPHGGTASHSIASCSTRPAPASASYAAIPTSNICAGPTISPRWPICSAVCSPPCGPCCARGVSWCTPPVPCCRMKTKCK